MGIKSKILAGFVIIGTMLFLSGTIAIYELKVLGKSMRALVDDNLKSIEVSRGMLNASAKINQGVLLALNGSVGKGKTLVLGEKTLYDSAFQKALNNITIKGERAIVDSIGSSYVAYMALVDSVFTSPIQKDMAWYYKNFMPVENDLNGNIESLITINQNALYSTSVLVEEGTYRAFVPGIIAIAAGLIFVILFNYFLNFYFVNPILKITQGVENYLKHAMPFRVKIETKDEINHLEKSIEKLIQMDKNNKIVD